ncbi:GNAT family N-acetyltransferase [Bradyrhizobium sp. CCBAU 051011]|nr:GNAT family N-acetyltransferase [Bradyrhizobium sp. CCBAU 051011]
MAVQRRSRHVANRLAKAGLLVSLSINKTDRGNHATAASRKFPVLSTRRLTLRAAMPKDVPAFRALLSIPDVTRFSNWPDTPSTTRVERSLRWMSKIHGSGKGCAWIIEISGSKALAGAIRFNSFEKKWRCGQIGYELHPDYWGKGLMTEAVRAVVACGHETFRLNRIDAWTLPGNAASDRVLEKSGFQYEGTLRQKAWFKGAFHDFRIFGRIAGDAASAN